MTELNARGQKAFNITAKKNVESRADSRSGSMSC